MITNRFNLPDTIYQAIKNDFHNTAGDISVSQLIDAPQIRVLKKLHRDEIQEDVSEKVAALFGSGIHAILEQANHSNRVQKSFDDIKNYFINKKNEAKSTVELSYANENIKIIDSLIDAEFPDKPEDKYMFERTLHITVDDMVISGTFDLFEKSTGKLQDYKTCSTWAYIYPESKLSWVRQTNIYAYLLREHGYEVNEISVVAIFKDFSKSKIVQNKDYPKQPVIEMPIELYPHEKVGAYIKERVRLHKQAELGNVIECTGAERWAKADMWAVMAKGAKRALPNSLCQSEIAAKKFLKMNEENYEGLYIDYRPGENKRCDEYCSVAQFCEQRKRYLNK